MMDLNLPHNERMKKILELPLPKQDEAIALWFSDPQVLADMRKRPYPTPPQKVAEYQRMDAKVKASMNKDPEAFKSFWLDQDVKKYFDDVETIRNLNLRNQNSLMWAKGLLENIDQAAVARIESTLLRFSDDVGAVEQPHWND